MAITKPISLRSIADELSIPTATLLSLIDLVENPSRINLLSVYQPGSNLGQNYTNLVNFKRFKIGNIMPNTPSYYTSTNPEIRLEVTRNLVNKPYNILDWENYDKSSNILKIEFSNKTNILSNWNLTFTIKSLNKDIISKILNSELKNCYIGFLYLFNKEDTKDIADAVVFHGGYDLATIDVNYSYSLLNIDSSILPNVNTYLIVRFMPIIFSSTTLVATTEKITNVNKSYIVIPEAFNNINIKKYFIKRPEDAFIIKLAIINSVLNPNEDLKYTFVQAILKTKDETFVFPRSLIGNINISLKSVELFSLFILRKELLDLSITIEYSNATTTKYGRINYVTHDDDTQALINSLGNKVLITANEKSKWCQLQYTF